MVDFGCIADADGRGNAVPLQGVNLFATLGNIGRHHDAYVMLRDGFNQGAARALLEEVSRWVPDLDGNLVRDFQTSGYSARVWELYLWVALRALNFDMDYAHAAPDFCVRKGEETVFIEATTVNAQDTFSSAIGAGPPDAPEQLWAFLECEIASKRDPTHEAVHIIDHTKEFRTLAGSRFARNVTPPYCAFS